MKENQKGGHGSGTAFTLIELLVSMSILVLLLLMLVSMTNATQKTWSYTARKIEHFREAREAFEAITRRLSQATLNTYWDYLRDSSGIPTNYIRQSELRFISGDTQTLRIATNRPTHAIFFQAPMGFVSDATYGGLENLLNIWGYGIEFSDDSNLRPPFLAAMTNPPALRNRFRLMEMMQPSESLALYQAEKDAGNDAQGNSKYKGANGMTWFTKPLGAAGGASRPVRVLAENVVALVLLPKLTPLEDSTGTKLAPNYSYDSTGSNPDPAINPNNQLPPVVQVTMVAVDEASFSRFPGMQASTPPMPDFSGSLFLDATKYDADLQTLQDTLQANKLNCRVFTTEVSLKAAKWSREQRN